MFVDRSGNVWVASVGEGLARLDGNRLMPVSLSGVTELKAIASMTLDPAGGWWFSDTFKGLFHFSGGALTQVKPPAAALNGYVYTDSRGRVWISHTGSVYLYQDGQLPWAVFSCFRMMAREICGLGVRTGSRSL
jgi:ligand-binding sensor domain-containing protein